MRLFWRILLSFWLAMVIVGVAALAIQRGLLEQDEVAPRLVRVLAEIGVERARAGPEPFDRWRRRLERATGSRVFLVGPDGRDAGGRPLPPRLEELLAGAAPDASRRRWVPGGTLLVAPVAADYRVVARIDRRAGPFEALPRGLRLLLLVTVTGIVCLALALWLTRPVRGMRAAAMRLADGDLSVRVGDSVGRRRDEIAELARDFDRMAERLQAMVGARERLLRDVSHELRSPLARMRVALELARNGGAGAGDQLDRLAREIERLDALIGDVLRLTRYEAAAEAPNADAVRLDALLGEVAADADFEAREAGRGVALESAPAVRVTGDPEILRSALENVVRNAVHHTPPDTSVSITLQRTGDTARVRVCDRGPGVPEAELDRIFEAFVRVGEARDRDSGGHGLGLAIARRAVEAHGGRIRARNEGRGLCIELELPAAGRPEGP